VDDDQSIRLAVGKFLRSRGYEVSVAASGGEARALADLPAEAAVEKLRSVAAGRLSSSDLDVILRIRANRKSLPQRDESR
jgi:DNA-binding response OmpR family regulator